jgi:hypothetical protein
VLVSLIIMTDFACCCLKTAHGCICAGVLIPACKPTCCPMTLMLD